ncbi:hypothetical protein D3C87_240870 [compost metagenome]
MKNDALLNLIEAQLKETRNMKQKAADLVNTVVNLYTLQLMKLGDIPIHFMEDIMADLEAEVIEIYRKKTYGFLTLEEYRQHKFRQKADN